MKTWHETINKSFVHKLHTVTVYQNTNESNSMTFLICKYTLTNYIIHLIIMVNDINLPFRLTCMVLRIFDVKSHCPQSQSSEPESEQTVLLPAAPLSPRSRIYMSATSSIHNPSFDSETHAVVPSHRCETDCINCVQQSTYRAFKR